MNGRGHMADTKKLMITIGVTNTVLLSMTAAPPAEAKDSRYKGKRPAKKQKVTVGDEQVIVRQRGNMLYVTVHGAPGRYVGIFYSQIARKRSDFKLVPNKVARIGKDGRTKLKMNVTSIRAKKFYLGLGVAKDRAFENLDSETEVVEVNVSPAATARIAGFDKLEALNKPSITRTRYVACKGGGGGKGGGGLGGAIGGLAKKGMGMAKGFVKEQGGIGGMLNKKKTIPKRPALKKKSKYTIKRKPD